MDALSNEVHTVSFVIKPQYQYLSICCKVHISCKVAYLNLLIK